MSATRAEALFVRLGFDTPRLKRALVPASTGCLALLVAWLVGLEHPQWSALTVWTAMLPTRGQLLEKSLFRFLGTISGTLAGVLLVLVSIDRPAVLVVGLAGWIAACAGIGNLQRGFVAYGTILAGYSAAMVALLDAGHPDQIFALGLDRFLTIAVGVAAALVVGLLVTPKRAEAPLLERLRLLSARVLDDMAASLGGARRAGELNRLLEDMAAIEDALDVHGAGSLKARQSAHAFRALLDAEISALIWLRDPPCAGRGDSGCAAALERAAEALRAPPISLETVHKELDEAIGRAGDDAGLRAVLTVLRPALERAFGKPSPRREAWSPSAVLSLHRDWIGARQAGIRAFVAMLSVGVVWLVTGWSVGPFMLLGLAVMISLFSTFDNPAIMLRTAVLGQVLGAVGAIACRWLAWPLADNAFEVILLMMPFILLGAPIVANRRTASVSFDYNMVVLLLLQPAFPLTGTFTQSLASAGALISGPILALVAYRLVYPVDARRRMEHLAAMMVADLQRLARRTVSAGQEQIWRARVHHRLLRLVRWSGKVRGQDDEMTRGGLAVVTTGLAILHLRDLHGASGLPAITDRRMSGVLKRLERVGQDPARAARALRLMADRLRGRDGVNLDLLYRAADLIAASADFLARARP